jgi:ubiquinone/menaquinone biosynthesis C-methylase UbiE
VENRARYNRGAGVYEALVRRASLGQFERFYRAVAGELRDVPGGTIVDVGCGLGTLVPHLLPKVAPGGRIIGCDVADRMIERARSIAAEQGWRNVEFVRADVRDFAPPAPVEAVVFCLSLTTLPEPAACLARALRWLVPHGRLVILDSIPERSRPLARLLIHLKAPLVGARPEPQLLELARARLADSQIQRFHRGVYTLLSGARSARGDE